VNSFELGISDFKNLDETEFRLIVKIDGQEFLSLLNNDSDAIILTELEKSLTGKGEYLIFICSCGIADCGGWEKVKVEHLNGKIVWDFEFDDKDFNFEFEFNQYKNEIERIRFEVNQKKLKLSPQFIIYPEG